MPQECGTMPVSRAAREGEQVGAASNAWRKMTASEANFARWGVGTAWPYGWM